MKKKNSNIEIERYNPDFELLNKKLHIGKPSAMNIGINSVENTTVVRMEKLIFPLIAVVFFNAPLSMLFDCSLIEGMIVTASELISVDGIISNGNVMPIIIPNSESACDSV